MNMVEFAIAWAVGFFSCMIIEILHDEADKIGRYDYYNDCWEDIGTNPPPKSVSPGVPRIGTVPRPLLPPKRKE